MTGYSEPCPYCGAPLDFLGLEIEAAMLDAAGDEVYLPSACCDEFAGAWEACAGEWSPASLARLTDAPAGSRPRAILLGDDDRGVVDFNLRVEPVTYAEACAFVGRHHRHNEPPAGWLYGLGCYNGAELIGVVCTGQPVARCTDWYVHAAAVLPAGWAATALRLRLPPLPAGHAAPTVTCEVNRLCVTASAEHPGLVWNACSMLYGAAAREARRRGFERVITYTLQAEPGDTLIAAGWQRVAAVRGRSWNGPARAREDRHDTGDKWRWERRLHPRRSDAARLVRETLERRAFRKARAARRAAQKIGKEYGAAA